MQIKIISPQGVVYSSEAADRITVNTQSGVITILEDHKPLVTMLKPGEVEVTEKGQVYDFALSTGLLRVKRGSIVEIMADSAERSEDIDDEAAEKAILEAEEFLKTKDVIDEVDLARLQATIERETARIKFKRSRKSQVKPM
jgi:F-type H+-transporting ATPase subunit epsilon